MTATRTALSALISAATCFSARAMSGLMALSDFGRFSVMRQMASVVSTTRVSLGEEAIGEFFPLGYGSFNLRLALGYPKVGF